MTVWRSLWALAIVKNLNQTQNKMTYYNTTNETGKALEVNTKKALSEEQLVMIFMRLDKQYSAFQLYKTFILNGWEKPILTNIRRALSSLKKKGVLVKTNNKVPGMYGRPECIYRLNNL